MQVTVPTNELQDIPALERKHKGKLLTAQINGETATAEFIPVASLEFFVDVRNCNAWLCVGAWGGELHYEDDYTLDADLLEQLKDRVIYDDNDGAINFSGQYYPQSRKSAQLFRRLMKTAKLKSKGDSETT
jgi:hypothetical protein